MFISKLLYDTPCQKFARTGYIMHNGIFKDKANVEEFGYRSDSTSLSPITLLTQSSSLRLMPVTGPKDFLQPYVFCYFCILQPICRLSLEYYTFMHTVLPIICDSQNVIMPLTTKTESQHATDQSCNPKT